jgi:polysaccharide export outer membrane protein
MAPRAILLGLLLVAAVQILAPYALAQSGRLGVQTAASGASPRVSSAPPASTTPAAPVEAGYNLGPGDAIRVIVHNEPDLSVDQTVGPTGEIALPLLGAVSARNLTTTQLSQALEARYRAGYLRNPRVTITVVTFRPFYVVGEVNNPGAFPYAADLTPASAIAFAGGFSRSASRSRIYIRRAGAQQEFPFSMRDQVALHPGDTVRVGQSAMSVLGQLPLGLIP